MDKIPKDQVLKHLQFENPWWTEPHEINAPFKSYRPRAYSELFLPLIRMVQVRRAVILLGPRRVGKTVLIHHAIQSLIRDGVNPRHICYISIDNPIYNGCGLDELIRDCREASATSAEPGRRYVFVDEIQYLREWEVHLKALVDSGPDIRIIASGSAAAALRLKSRESGAGRFTDFLLPPLTFHEYLDLQGKSDLFQEIKEQREEGSAWYRPRDIETLNERFIHYLNFGGYPEVLFSPAIQSDPGRFIKGDIIDKVLLRDLPGLYGIRDIQELNSLFTSLAYNTAQEVSLEGIAQGSGVAKNTIKRYIEYLEAAFLLQTVHRIDRSAKRFQRANYFKVYLTNPSIRAALFSPLGPGDDALGPLVETGIFSQWFHDPVRLSLHYARWKQGEVDIVALDKLFKPSWAVEVKWSDRYADKPGELKSLIQFCSTNGLKRVAVTSRTVECVREVDGITMEFIPASTYCYNVGRNLVAGKRISSVGPGNSP